MKRMAAVFLAVAFCLSLCSCADYLGLDELTLVAGIAIDIDPEDENLYMVTLEVLDTTNPVKSEQVESTLIQSTGKTIFDAIYQANKWLNSNVYFGNTEIIIVSNKLAQRDGIVSVVDVTLRDFQFRDDPSIIISKEETAKALLEVNEPANTVISFTLAKNLGKSKTFTTSTPKLTLSKIYNILQEGTMQLALPAFVLETRTVNGDGTVSENSGAQGGESPSSQMQEGGGDTNEQQIIHAQGFAVFDREKMVCYLDEANTPYYLFLTRNVEGGSFSFSVVDGEEVGKNHAHDISVKVVESTPKLSCTFEGGQVTLKADVEVISSIIETPKDLEGISGDILSQIEEIAKTELEERISKTISEVQQESQMDIFGFADTIYRTNPQLFAQLREEWPEYFSKAKLDIHCDFKIDDTGMIYTYRSK